MQPSILLVNPEIDYRTQNKVLTDIIRISFPMSLGHLAGYLEARCGWPVAIHDRISFEAIRVLCESYGDLS